MRRHMRDQKPDSCRSSVHLLLCCSILGAGACSDLCRNEIVTESTAPDGKHAAYLVERDCGATTSASLHLSVGKSGGKVPETGNIFIADQGRKWNVPLEARIEWVAPDLLRVDLDPRLRLFKKEANTDGVKIEYLEKK
jgi:hypothetical protein